ncbi:MAG: HAD-IC family P-type ATPase [Patescibacteria group bacterium]|jgi:Ca2+-transporting ATPase|nr:HAD-IC family P-type ATPase [Patescibacteria group bacterium]
MLNFHSEDFKFAIDKFKTTFDGLTQVEAQKRLDSNGRNELPSKKPINKTAIFFSQFNNALIYILLIAGLLSFVLKDYIDAAIIFAAIFINTMIGYVQELKASNALSKLKQLVEHKAFVFRDGHEIEIDSIDIAVGDVVFVKAGNKVPADCRLLEAINLQVNESSLTGESVPSTKTINSVSVGAAVADRDCMIYAATVIARGSGRAVVVATGVDTEIGKIAKMVSEEKEEQTPLQKRLTVFSKQIGIYVVLLTLGIVVIGVLQGRTLFEMFLTGVALIVAAIPEGLTVALTVVLTIGMQQILKHKALVRKLVAAETLGSTTVICTDKTGTLTEGVMHVAHIVIGEKEFEVDALGSRQNQKEAKIVSLALQTAMMCNDALIENPQDELSIWRIIGGSTDVALYSAALQSGLNKDKLLKIEPLIDELPFESDLKYMISLHKRKEGYVMYEKGAPEKIIDKSDYFFHQGKKTKLTSKDKLSLNKNYKKLASKGLRIVAVAYKEFDSLEWEVGDKWETIDNKLIFIGFIALKDPLRAEAKETIEICRSAGIRPIIITGDYHLTAKAIASELGMKVSDSQILTGPDLDKINDDELKAVVKNISIYARVNPHHKLRIVKALKQRGEVVAMTGDGINDAPALKAADIGIALGTGTDIAKETSDMVLLDSNFKTIVDAVRYGRVIFDNIRKVITFLISDSFSQIILIAGSIVLGFPLALLPAQILWMNIVQDGIPGFTLAKEQDSSGVMDRKPIKKDEPILNKEMKLIIFTVGLSRDFLIFIIFIFMVKTSVDISYTRTFIFAALSTNSLMNLFSIRSLINPIWNSNPFSNKYLNIGAMISFLLLLVAVYFPPLQSILSTVPLGFYTWGVIILLGISTMLLIELVKHMYSNVYIKSTKKEKNV